MLNLVQKLLHREGGKFEMNNDELYHFGVKGMKWGVRRDLRKTARSHTKQIRQHQKEAAKYIGIAQNKSEYATYYDKKYRKATIKGKTEKANKYKVKSEQYKQESKDASKRYNASRERIQKAKDFVAKNSDLMVTYSHGNVVIGGTVDGGSLSVGYSKAKVRVNTEKNQRIYNKKQIEKGYNFVKTYVYYV